MKQVAWYFVGMEEEINNEGKKISTSICIKPFHVVWSSEHACVLFA